MVSFYCGLGMMYSWVWQLVHIVRHTWFDYRSSIAASPCLSWDETNCDDMLPGPMQRLTVMTRDWDSIFF
jgi:hypothetical protein